MKHPYSTIQYAKSLSHWGRPFHVPEWDTNVLIREISPGFEDASGTYPIAILDKNADIARGLERLRKHRLISVVLVLDDFHRPSLKTLHQYFTVIKQFKTHYIHDNNKEKIIYNRHHRYELRQALKSVDVAPLDLQNNIENWSALYSNLIVHKELTGLHAFPLKHHIALGKLEGITAIGAWQKDELISCHVWVSDGDYVHSHLAASSAQGYANRAAYAINDASIAYFSNAKIINFGGGIMQTNKTLDNLAQFKRGFSNNIALSYVCGAVLDEERYADLLLKNATIQQTDFFPAYRMNDK